MIAGRDGHRADLPERTRPPARPAHPSGDPILWWWRRGRARQGGRVRSFFRDLEVGRSGRMSPVAATAPNLSYAARMTWPLAPPIKPMKAEGTSKPSYR